jgi:hypothetical protein
LHEPFSAQIRSNRDRLMRLGRDHVEATFAPELDATAAEDRRTLLDALQSASSWATWEGLRSDLHLDVEAARAVVVRILTALLHGRAGPQLGRGKPSSSE